jgi:ABC-type Fe3+ transport system substrate-binding protein
MSTRLSRLGAVLLALALLAACAPSGRSTPTGAAPAATGRQSASAPAQAAPVPEALAAALTMPIDELHERAKAEGGTFACYCTMAQINAEKIMPAFEQRFPGVKVDHVDATADKLVARVVAEGRGGKVLADVFSANLEYIVQLERQGFLLAALPPEAQAMPEGLRGAGWVASDLQYIVAAWNTNLVRPEEAPTQLEDFADPRWKGRLIAEPRDVELLVALVRKQGSEGKGIEVLRRIAANDVEFHKGHSDLAELLAAGQAAACITCYAHHYPPRIRRGAPLDVMLTEGIGLIVGNAVMKDAPHPYTAMLWQRWAASEEGQQMYAEGGRTPALPSVAPRERNRPDKLYPITPDDLAATNRLDRTWKEVFQLR